MSTSNYIFLQNSTSAFLNLLIIIDEILDFLKLKTNKLSSEKIKIEPKSVDKNLMTTTQKKTAKKEEIDLARKNKEMITPADLNGKKILVVDDNIMNRMVANVILQEFNVTIIEAVDGQDAVNYLSENSCDLILMDLQMPVLDGYKASEIIRQRLNLHMPIIALTASDLNEERERCTEVGMNDYLSKPFNKEQLVEIICKWIGN